MIDSGGFQVPPGRPSALQPNYLMWTALRRLFCPSHHYRIVGEVGTMFLQCRICGHRTTGVVLRSESDHSQPPTVGVRASST